MQVYVGLLYQDIVRQNHLAADGRLPPVLPLVLYHGAAPWRVSTDMAGLMLPPPAGLEPFQPEQRYLLIDRACFGSGRGGSDCNLIDSLFDMIDARS